MSLLILSVMAQVRPTSLACIVTESRQRKPDMVSNLTLLSRPS
jgi:hypothetical protein